MSSGITPISIGGISKYASDFQSILTRAVSFASIPVQRLQIAQAKIQQQAQTASQLSSAVAAVAADLKNLGKLGTSKALSASSTDNSIVSAQVTGATAGASYAITNVTSVASAAAESSVSSYSDATTIPVSTTGSLELTVGGTTTPITLTAESNNLAGLRDAINSLNQGVTAQILTTAGGDYLSVSANNPGATTLTLVDDPTGAATQLLTSSNQGTDSVFQLNGVNISTPQTTINNIVPGLTFTINGKTAADQTVNVSLSSNTSQVSSALQNLTSDYNNLAQLVKAQAGTGGVLEGDSVLWQLRNSMLQLSGFSNGSGSIHSLAAMGVTFDQTGQASFDASQLSGLSNSQIGDAFTFLGSATTGLGGLATRFSQISDPVTGVIASEIKGWNDANQRLNKSINDATARVNLQQTLLAKQLEAADANVAQLESQQNLLTSSIQSLQYSTYGQQLSSQGL
jgi:flagellar hook-associated protein 2